MTKNWNIDILKFLLCFVVIAIHTHIAPNGSYLNNLFNLCVPIYFSISGYYIFQKAETNGEAYINHTIKRYLLLYLRWSIIYLPLTIYGYTIRPDTNISGALLVMSRYILTGDQYMSWIMWYVLAMIVSLLIYKLGRYTCQLSYEKMIMVAVCLTLLGVWMEYNHNCNISQIYFSIFKTTRNGFFVGYSYLISGMLIAKYNLQNLRKHLLLALTALGILTLGILGSLPIDIARLICQAPIIVLLAWILSFRQTSWAHNIPIRSLSTWIFFIHMYCVFTLEHWMRATGWICYLGVCVLSIISGLFILEVGKRISFVRNLYQG